ncbi:MAG TPA: hypothetical protein PKC45_00430 [Gemmatales bacterium]|mgnify:CR=1 FL=1|nr:hypothetical protein [Gemmatales bacterium]
MFNPRIPPGADAALGELILDAYHSVLPCLGGIHFFEQAPALFPKNALTEHQRDRVLGVVQRLDKGLRASCDCINAAEVLLRGDPASLDGWEGTTWHRLAREIALAVSNVVLVAFSQRHKQEGRLCGPFDFFDGQRGIQDDAWLPGTWTVLRAKLAAFNWPDHGKLMLGVQRECLDALQRLPRAAEAASPAAEQGEGGTPPADPFADLRQYARAELKGQERAVIEALCDAGGELPIADLAVKRGVGWDDVNKGFESAQRRLNPKIKKQRWKLTRQNNAARLTDIPA